MTMAALNQTETSGLMEAQSTLEAILKEGFDPNDSPANVLKKKQIEKARDAVKVVVTMKGCYPS